MNSRQPSESPVPRAELADEADDWIQVLFATSPGGIVLQDAEAGILLANPAAERILGLSLAQLQGRTSVDPRWRAVREDGSPFPGEEHPAMAALSSGTVVANVTMGIFDPAREETRWLDVSAIPVPRRDPSATARVVVTFSDITERKRMTEQRDRLLTELQQSAMELDGIFEALPYLVSLHGRDGRYLRSNPTLRKVFGFDPVHHSREVIAQQLRARFPDGRPITREQMPSARALAGETVHDVEYTITDSLGNDHKLLMNAIPLWQDGVVQGAVLAQQDITGRKQAERDNVRLQALLQQSRRMESLGSLAGGVAHEMNNVLGAILALASVNLKLLAAGDPGFEAFRTIAQAATRGGAVVKSLLSFARNDLAEIGALDLNAIVREDANLVERTTFARIRIVLELEPELTPTAGDPGAVRQALMNLCLNALEAMPDGGSLTLRTRNLGTEQVEVTIEDTGVGMTQEVLDRAVDPFFTTRAAGQAVGLGLSQVYSIMKAHKGDLELQSEVGQGTRVSLRFPVRPAPASAPAPTGNRQRLEILLVDDDELIQASIGMTLRALGHQVSTAPCGEDALQAIQAGLRPDLVILDVNMPGLGGAGTLPVLRRLCPETPVLVATGRADQAVLALVGTHPRASLLAKPYSLEDLERFLGRLAAPGAISS
jgi:PAS domain S-box-containing protein